jgi:serine/alanine adding enzyme
MAATAPRIAGAPIVVRDRVSAARRDEYALRHPDASVYHQAAWLDLFSREFGRDTKCLVAEAGDRIVGLLPLVFFSNPIFGRFAVSIPFVNYGGVLADSVEAEQALLERAIEDTRAAGGAHLELRHTRQVYATLTPRRHKVAMLLGLEKSADEQWQALDRKVRNQVRKAEKHGLDWVEGGAELVPEFHAVFARNMRDLGTPAYGESFFRDVVGTFPQAARVCVIRRGRVPMAASIIIQHRDTIEVPWASALRESNPLSVNVLLYWRMLTLAIARGARTFDFGRSTPDEGTFHFKKQWGAQPRQLVWEYWTADGRAVPDLSPKNGKFALAIRVWQHLPVSLATAVGPSIVRHIP